MLNCHEAAPCAVFVRHKINHSWRSFSMAISLQKGGNVNLSKEAPNLSTIVIGLGWDPRSSDGAAFDLDGSAFLLKADGKARSDSDFIFYNNLKSADGSVVHAGDNRDGGG